MAISRQQLSVSYTKQCRWLLKPLDSTNCIRPQLHRRDHACASGSPDPSSIMSVRLGVRVRLYKPNAFFQKSPIDKPGEFGQRVAHVEDLIQSGTKQVKGVTVLGFFRPHVDHLDHINNRRESHPQPRINLQGNGACQHAFLQIRIREEAVIK